MADIFVSYKKDDITLAERFVLALESEGYSVWWDSDLDPREHWDAEIEREISAASVVVVIWTSNSVSANTFVRNEADYAKENGKLVQVRADLCELPLAFRRIQAVDMVDWDGQHSHRSWKKLVASIESVRSGAGVGATQDHAGAPTSLLVSKLRWSGPALASPRTGENWGLIGTARAPMTLGGANLVSRMTIDQWCWCGENILYIAQTKFAKNNVYRFNWRDGSQKILRSRPSRCIRNLASFSDGNLDFADTDCRGVHLWASSRGMAQELTDVGSVSSKQIYNLGRFPFEQGQSGNHHSGDRFHDLGQRIAISPDRQYLAYQLGRLDMGAERGSGWVLGVWPLEAGADRVMEVESECAANYGLEWFSWSPTSEYICLGSSSAASFLRRKDLEQESFATVDGWSFHYQPVWHPHRDIVAIASYQRTTSDVYLWRVEIVEVSSQRRLYVRDLGHTRDIVALAWSPEGRYIASASLDGSVVLWDLDTDSTDVLFRGAESPRYLEFSPNSQRLAVCEGGARSQISIWGHVDSVEVARFFGRGRIVNAAQPTVSGGMWHESSKYLASSKTGNEIEVRELRA